MVWIEGAIGTGKTTIVRRLVTEAARGNTVLRAHADELATEASLALLSQLVDVDAATRSPPGCASSSTSGPCRPRAP